MRGASISFEAAPRARAINKMQRKINCTVNRPTGQANRDANFDVLLLA